MADELTHPVAKVSAEVNAMLPYWQIVADLLNGTSAMRAAKTKYLPKWPKETVPNYDIRVSGSTLFPAYSRTVFTLGCKPFSQPITFNDDIPAEIQPFLEDIDMTGRNIAGYLNDQLYKAIGYGLAGTLVDFPVRDDVANTIEAEKAAGLRPYFIDIKVMDLLGWQSQVINGKRALTQLRYFENVDVKSDDGYSTNTIRQIKVWNIGSNEVWRLDSQKNWVLFQKRAVLIKDKPITFIPFAPTYGLYQGFMCAKPPLLELAYLNIKHWQSQSDQDNLLRTARVPILITQSDDDKFQFTIAGNVSIRVPMDADVKYVEHTGQAIGAGKISLDDLKEEMRQAGAELLVKFDVPVTATQINSDSSVGMCALQQITQSCQDSANLALQFMAQWLGLPEGGHIKLFNEFGAATFDDAFTQMLPGLPALKLLSRESVYGELQRRYNVNPGVAWKDEQPKIDDDEILNPPPVPVIADPKNIVQAKPVA